MYILHNYICGKIVRPSVSIECVPHKLIIQTREIDGRINLFTSSLSFLRDSVLRVVSALPSSVNDVLLQFGCQYL